MWGVCCLHVIVRSTTTTSLISTYSSPFLLIWAEFIVFKSTVKMSVSSSAYPAYGMLGQSLFRRSSVDTRNYLSARSLSQSSVWPSALILLTSARHWRTTWTNFLNDTQRWRRKMQTLDIDVNILALTVTALWQIVIFMHGFCNLGSVYLNKLPTLKQRRKFRGMVQSDVTMTYRFYVRCLSGYDNNWLNGFVSGAITPFLRSSTTNMIVQLLQSTVWCTTWLLLTTIPSEYKRTLSQCWPFMQVCFCDDQIVLYCLSQNTTIMHNAK